MSYTIQQLKTRVIAGLHGTTLNQVKDFNGAIYNAASQFMLDYDAPETKRYVQVLNVFTDAYDYGVPVDLKGDKIIDIFPQVKRDYSNNFYNNYNRRFDRTKGLWNRNKFSVNYNSFVKTIRIDYEFGHPVVTVATVNGLDNWTGTVNGITVDNQIVAESANSLFFDFTNTGYVQDTLSNPINLGTNFINGSFFVWFYFNEASLMTNVSLRVGTDSANYAQMTTNVTASGTSFINGWNQLRFDMSNATIVGSIVDTNFISDETGEAIEDETGDPIGDETETVGSFNVGFVRYDFVSTGHVYVNMDNTNFNISSILEMEYYSKYLFRDAITGAFKESPTSDMDLVNLDTDSIRVFVCLIQCYVAQQVAGANSMFDFQFFNNMYEEGLKKLRQTYRSEIISPTDIYYRKINSAY